MASIKPEHLKPSQDPTGGPIKVTSLVLSSDWKRDVTIVVVKVYFNRNIIEI